MATKTPPDAFYFWRAEENGFMPRGYELYTIDTTILRINSKSTKKSIPRIQTDSGNRLVRDFRFGCVASERGLRSWLAVR
jgi:hypothetical protein